MNISKISSTGQTTVPAEVRKFLHLKKSDRIKFEINKEDSIVVIKKVEPFDVEFAISLENTLSNEWNSSEDNEAYNDL